MYCITKFWGICRHPNVYIQNYSGDKVNNMTSMVLEQSKQTFQNQKYKDFKLFVANFKQ